MIFSLRILFVVLCMIHQIIISMVAGVLYGYSSAVDDVLLEYTVSRRCSWVGTLRGADSNIVCHAWRISSHQIPVNMTLSSDSNFSARACLIVCFQVFSSFFIVLPAFFFVACFDFDFMRSCFVFAYFFDVKCLLPCLVT